MARSERNSVDYFPYYCKEGKVMFYIENKYLNDGFATWVKILRQLAVTNYHYLDLSSKVDLMFLSSKCRVPESVLESIISDLADLGEFDKMLWYENRIIWCQKLVDSVQDAYKKRNNECVTYEALLDLLCSLGVRKQPKSITKGDGNTQSILKDSKVKKTKVEYPSENEFLEYAKTIEIYKPSFDFQIKAKYAAWKENGWKDGNGNAVKNWKTKLMNTMPFFKDVQPTPFNQPKSTIMPGVIKAGFQEKHQDNGR